MVLCLVPGGSWASRKLHKSWDLIQLAFSEILWHLDWNCQGEQHCVQRCPKGWLSVPVSFLLQPGWFTLRHPQPFLIWRCEILEPLRPHRYSISRFPVRVRVQTSVNEGFATTTGHTPSHTRKGNEELKIPGEDLNVLRIFELWSVSRVSSIFSRIWVQLWGFKAYACTHYITLWGIQSLACTPWSLFHLARVK